MRSRIRILLADDDEVDRMCIRRALRNPALEVDTEETFDVRSAVQALRHGRFDCAVVDFNLPDGDAFDILRQINGGSSPSTPIIVLTGLENEDLGLRLLAAGAQDYLGKTALATDTLARAIRYAIERHRIQQALDAANARLEALSLQDPLTELLNRRGLERVLEIEIPRSERVAQPLLALLVDCDDFKRVNEIFGLTVGDQALAQIADCLRKVARSDDYVARIGGDEFVVLLPQTRITDAVAVGERICSEVRDHPLVLAGGEVPLSVSVGAAPVPRSSNAIRDVVAAAHVALRRVKTHGKGQVVWVDSPTQADFPSDLSQLEAELRSGGALTCARQPVIELKTRQTVGYELLARGPQSFYKPDEFFAAARELDILTHVDLGCLDQCLAATLGLPEEMRLYVNIFPVTLLATPIEELISRFTARERRSRIFVDLSDRWIFGDLSRVRRPLAALREVGIRVALDHVGFGRSSLEALLVLGPQVIKTAPQLVQGVAREPAKQRSLSRLLAIAESIDAELIVLGIESEEDLDAVCQLGASLGQGFLLGEPARFS